MPAVSLAFFLLWIDRQFGTHFFDAAQRRPAAAVAAPVLDVRPSLGLRRSCCRPWASSRTGCRCSAAGRSSATRRSRSRPSPRWSWASACGCTTCSRPACRLWRCRSSPRASIMIAIPSAVAVFAWIATIWTGRPVITTAFLFFAGFIMLFVIGGVSGFMTASGAGRLAAHRHLFRRRPPSLRADRHQRLPGARRPSTSGFPR